VVYFRRFYLVYILTFRFRDAYGAKSLGTKRLGYECLKAHGTTVEYEAQRTVLTSLACRSVVYGARTAAVHMTLSHSNIIKL